MKNNARITVIVLLIVLVLASLIYFISQQNDKEFNWYENYESKSKQPYGLAFIRELLPSYFPGSNIQINKKKKLSEVLGEKDSTLYLFIGETHYLNSADQEALQTFIKNGGTAFVSSNNFPYSLLSDAYTSPCVESLNYLYNDLEEVGMNFYHSALKRNQNYKFRYREKNQDRVYYWKSLDVNAVCELEKNITPLGYLESDDLYINFFRMSIGKGVVYFHSNPIIFTNYFITKKENLPYVDGVMSHLYAKNIIWDEKSKVPLYSNESGAGSPLYYILQQPSLKYAWWLFLFGVLLYLIFAAKRKQREIPVLEKKNNTSLEYVRMVAALHFQNGNHLDIARKKMKYFFHFVRNRYGIHLALDQAHSIELLSQKSNVSKSVIESIAEQYHLVDRYSYTNIEADKLSKLYFAIDQFYKSCK